MVAFEYNLSARHQNNFRGGFGGGLFIWCLADEFRLKANLFGARGAEGLFGGLGLALTEPYSEEQGRL